MSGRGLRLAPALAPALKLAPLRRASSELETNFEMIGCGSWTSSSQMQFPHPGPRAGYRIGPHEYFDRGRDRLRYCNIRWRPMAVVGHSLPSHSTPSGAIVRFG